MPNVQRVFITDCEGPISKNDNAFELSSQIIPNGDKIFSVISKYDDVEADVVKRPDYNAGDTLKLILPTFRAFGATDELMEEYSSNNVLLVPGAKETLGEVEPLKPHIVSTSYEHYIRALCGIVDFPFENTYSTRLRINNYGISESERARLQEIAKEVVEMPVMTIPSSNSLDDFSAEDRRNIERLDKIFWEEIPQMGIGRILKEVKPVGGHEKANAVKEISEKLGVKLSEVMYVGDSITDQKAFRLVRDAGGLTVSFNGNDYAVREAEVGITAPHTDMISIIAETFRDEGREGVIETAKEFPRVEVIVPENMEEFSKHSSRFRKTVRGEPIGKLG